MHPLCYLFRFLAFFRCATFRILVCLSKTIVILMFSLGQTAGKWVYQILTHNLQRKWIGQKFLSRGSEKVNDLWAKNDAYNLRFQDLLFQLDCHWRHYYKCLKVGNYCYRLMPSQGSHIMETLRQCCCKANKKLLRWAMRLDRKLAQRWTLVQQPL